MVARPREHLQIYMLQLSGQNSARRCDMLLGLQHCFNAMSGLHTTAICIAKSSDKQSQSRSLEMNVFNGTSATLIRCMYLCSSVSSAVSPRSGKNSFMGTKGTYSRGLCYPLTGTWPNIVTQPSNMNSSDDSTPSSADKMDLAGRQGFA